MRRGAESRSAAVAATALAIFVVALVPATAAGQSALEEYILTLPGVETVEASAAPDLDPARNAGPGGVTGERQEAPAPIAALGATATRPGVIAVAVGLALTVGFMRRREPGR